MNPRRVIASIVVAFLVIGVLVIYSLQTSPSPRMTTITSTSTVTISGGLTTTTVLGQVKVISVTGSQAVLCTATSYFIPDTVTSTNQSTAVQTYSKVSGDVTTIFTDSGSGPVTTTYLSVYASATNATQSAGYVVASTSSGYVGMSSRSTVMTCTYLP
jgi:hypothetical protein